MSERVTIGIDLGGTGTRIVALATDGQVVAEDITPTSVEGSPRRAVHDLAEQVRVTAGAAAITAVGIGASGPVDGDGLMPPVRPSTDSTCATGANPRSARVAATTPSSGRGTGTSSGPGLAGTGFWVVAAGT